MGVAVVTGASSGLGLSLSLGLVSGGKQVVCVSRTYPSDAHLRSEIDTGNVAHVSGDVSDPDTAESAFAQAHEMGTPDLLINCAGVGVFGPTGSYTRQDLEDVFAGNLYGTILFCEAGYRSFRASGGTIVNVMSTAAQVGRVNEAVYCAAKWGARGYTESLRLEAKGTPIRIVAVYPGGMKTPFWQVGRGANLDPSGFMDAEEVARAILRNLDDQGAGHVSDITINRT